MSILFKNADWVNAIKLYFNYQKKTTAFVPFRLKCRASRSFSDRNGNENACRVLIKQRETT